MSKNVSNTPRIEEIFFFVKSTTKIKTCLKTKVCGFYDEMEKICFFIERKKFKEMEKTNDHFFDSNLQ